jgi:hypothetical protein
MEFMRTLAFSVLLGLGLLVVGGSRAGLAKGNPLAVTPDAGPAGTAVQLSSDLWQPGVEVEVYVGASVTYTEPSSYAGPVTTATSDASGQWSLDVNLTRLPGFALPHAPSFVVFRAVSQSTATTTTGATDALAFFAITVDGRRPDGAGGIDLTIVGPSATAWLDWEPAGSPMFYISHVGPFGPPLRDYALGHLANGDWDVVVPSTLVPVAATGGRVITVRATLCASASIPCDPRPGPLTVVRVPVRDGEVSQTTITLGEPTHLTAAPATGFGGAGGPLTWREPAIFALCAAGAFAFMSGIALRGRRGTS